MNAAFRLKESLPRDFPTVIFWLEISREKNVVELWAECEREKHVLLEIMSDGRINRHSIKDTTLDGPLKVDPSGFLAHVG